MKSLYILLVCLLSVSLNGQEYQVDEFYQVAGSSFESCFVQDVPGGYGKYVGTTASFDATLNTDQSELELGNGLEGVFIGLLWDNAWEWGYTFDVSMYTSLVNYHVDNYGNIHTTMGFRGHLWLMDKYGNILFEADSEKRANLVAGFDMYGQLLYIFTLGNEKLNDIMAITVDNHGNTIISGMFWGQLDFSPGEIETILDAKSCGDGFIAKYKGDELIWAHHFPGSLNNYVWALDTDFNRNIYGCGTFGNNITCSNSGQPFDFESKGGGDAFAVSFSQDGNIRWGHQVGSTEYDRLNAIKVYGDRVFFGGIVSEDISDPNQFGVSTNGNADAIVLSLDLDGNFQWIENIGGAGFDRLSCMDVDYYSGLWIVGQAEDEIFWSSDNQSLNPGVVGRKNFLLQIDHYSGELTNYYSFDGNMDYRQINSLKVESHGASISMSGSFSDTVDFSINSEPYVVETLANDDGFYIKYKPAETNIVKTFINQDLIIFPNPVADVIRMSPSSENFSSYEIVSINGNLVESVNTINQNELNISVLDLIPGAYIINVYNQDKILLSKKFIKQ